MKKKRDFKKDFEEWLLTDDWMVDEIWLNDLYFFNQLPKSMQWGVYEDFFDSVDIQIEVNIIPNNPTRYVYRIWYNRKLNTYTSDFETRPEAREKAIEKAQEIYEHGYK